MIGCRCLILVIQVACFLSKMEVLGIIAFISCTLMPNGLLGSNVVSITYLTYPITVDFIYLIHGHLIVNFIFKYNFND